MEAPGPGGLAGGPRFVEVSVLVSVLVDRARHETGLAVVTVVDTHEAILCLGAPALRPQHPPRVGLGVHHHYSR